MARVYSISTGERVHAWQPHEDYIRSITVHPTLPIILTASDDCTIKSWDWDKAWRCTQVRSGSAVVLRYRWLTRDGLTGL